MSMMDIVQALGGQRAGATWMARCPGHGDREPSLAIREGRGGKVLFHCHAGCGQDRVLAALRARGLWPGNDTPDFARVAIRARAGYRPGSDAAKRRAVALTTWKSCVPAGGTLAESYLRTRGLNLPLPPVLRFHPGLRHPTGDIWPAMVALVTRGSDNAPVAIHRTFLARDGAGKAPVTPTKMMLGLCRGGAVRLAASTDMLMVGEGIETCLSAMQATGLPAWAALSASGLSALELPESVRDVIILADGDDRGEEAARDCALRWHREGRRARIARPPWGMDFNDLLMGGSLRIEEKAQ